MRMTKGAAKAAFESAEVKANEAVSLYAKPIGLGARHSIEHQGIQALAEAVRDLAHGLQELSEEVD